jgi:hypothetical protein
MPSIACPISRGSRHLHIFGVIASPYEADPELIVDPDRVLACTVALEGLEPVRRRRLEVLELAGLGQHDQLPPRDPDKVGREAFARVVTHEERLSSRVPEAPDHVGNVSYRDTFRQTGSIIPRYE